MVMSSGMLNLGNANFIAQRLETVNYTLFSYEDTFYSLTCSMVNLV